MGEEQVLIPHLFRLEYSKMTAVLCRHFGLNHIETAEDIASETFLKASEVWAINGIPDNPTAWLYTVARNKTRDHLKHLHVFETKVSKALKTEGSSTDQGPDPDFTAKTIKDSQLAMIFAVCNPANAAEAQICLALQILCGFSVQEIADAFLTGAETVKKRLYRARINLRNDHFQIATPEPSEIISRQETVLRTIYLLFNEGYFSRSGDDLVRKDLCSEAIRLALVLKDQPLTDTRETDALLALMCFQSSRFDARSDESGESILFEQQDTSRWNRELIDRGNYYLVSACSGQPISKYHLEAGIAYWHTLPSAEMKWENILQLYNQLLLLEYSPITALNRTFALAKVQGHKAAIIEAEKLGMEQLDSYHALLGYLFAPLNAEKSIRHYSRAIDLTRSPIERKTLVRELEKIRNISI